ncbi:hypothetical protein FYK55_16915 [Roseiconus nitratireducens]|uniref:ABC-2 type transport system permease protein n=1 Tax=Roseiconus nitratireducens TaxID=2605748 RepID=A0A5M6D5M9_9BACT|nr:hypothetical protein [Roseiconus nitratireducens]KAA5541880.1 hypothetical protein FYK55_16915 [Roseiconus nitratireducens]
MQTPHQHLLWLTIHRGIFRLRRGVDRMRSPRRILATILAALFLSAYVLNGFFVLWSRRTADPQSLRLWLSGGMILYLIYHSVRCVWTEKQVDMEYTDAENLWLGGAPLKRSTVAAYKVNTMMVSALLKTFFLSVVLAPDVSHFALLSVGVFAALVLLETARMVWQRLLGGLSERHRVAARVSLTAVGIAALIQMFGHMVRITPPGSDPGHYVLNSFRAVGYVASCDIVQWLAIPWRPAALLATTSQITTHTAVQLLAAVALIPTAIIALVRIDGWAERCKLQREQARLAAGDYISPQQRMTGQRTAYSADTLADRIESLCPERLRDAVALLWRQALSIRRYAGTIVFSFVLPTVLCLSPLLTGRAGNQWAFVVAGIALCTMLLAPPALRLDFRRDLKRMLLLRSLPLRPIHAVLGQLTLPVLITIGFQWITLLIAGLLVSPGWSQIIVWSGMLSALAVFTFAAENALFLAYPHHESAQGFAMVVRANVMFVGKATVIGVAVAALMLWITLCRTAFADPVSTPIYVIGAIGASWAVAASALSITAWCWNHFDISADLPPE